MEGMSVGRRCGARTFPSTASSSVAQIQTPHREAQRDTEAVFFCVESFGDRAYRRASDQASKHASNQVRCVAVVVATSARVARLHAHCQHLLNGPSSVRLAQHARLKHSLAPPSSSVSQSRQSASLTVEMDRLKNRLDSDTLGACGVGHARLGRLALVSHLA